MALCCNRFQRAHVFRFECGAMFTPRCGDQKEPRPSHRSQIVERAHLLDCHLSPQQGVAQMDHMSYTIHECIFFSRVQLNHVATVATRRIARVHRRRASTRRAEDEAGAGSVVSFDARHREPVRSHASLP